MKMLKMSSSCEWFSLQLWKSQEVVQSPSAIVLKYGVCWVSCGLCNRVLQDLTRTCWCWDHFAYSLSLYIIYVHVCIHKHTVNVQPQIPTLIQSTHGKFGQEARLPLPIWNSNCSFNILFSMIGRSSPPIKMDQSPHLLVVHKHWWLLVRKHHWALRDLLTKSLPVSIGHPVHKHQLQCCTSLHQA